MLILTRRIKEAITFGDDIIISVIGIKWKKAGIKINSPKIPKLNQKEIFLKIGSTFIITDEIKIHILGVHGLQVRIGIDAPMNIVIHREEIYIKIQEENHTTKKPGLIQRFINLFKQE